MTIDQALWILEHQIGPNVYGLKWVAVLRILEHHGKKGPMNREQLTESVARMKITASMFVQRYAALNARDVPQADVDAICNALGDISIDEATAALDRQQAKIGPARS
jgi:hypothetical protein